MSVGYRFGRRIVFSRINTVYRISSIRWPGTSKILAGNSFSPGPISVVGTFHNSGRTVRVAEKQMLAIDCSLTDLCVFSSHRCKKNMAGTEFVEAHPVADSAQTESRRGRFLNCLSLVSYRPEPLQYAGLIRLRIRIAEERGALCPRSIEIQIHFRGMPIDKNPNPPV